jgi:hypothetical protein
VASPPNAPSILEIERLDGGRLVLHGAALAYDFFTRDPSSIAVGAYDHVAADSTFDTIETADIETLNRTMRARSPHPAWASVTGIPLPWLRAIPSDFDLIEMTANEWEARAGEQLVHAALRAVVAHGRGVAVATKMLHLKRPRLFPLLDRLVVEMLGARFPEGAAEVRAAQAAQLVTHVRAEGRRNLDALMTIQSQLAALGCERSLVRILDAVMWLSHPAAGVSGPSRRTFEVRSTSPTPFNLRRIEFLAWAEGDEAESEGHAWVDADGYVQADTDRVNFYLDGGIGVPNVLTRPRRGAKREDGAAMLYGYLMEASVASYWGVRVVQVDDERESFGASAG